MFESSRDTAMEYVEHGRRTYSELAAWKKGLVLAGLAVLGTMGILFIIFHDKFFELMVEFAKKWKEMPGGGVLMFSMIILISFPPLIGYSALSSLVGMMYGFPWGWPFLASATLVGSTLSFLTFRYFLSDYAKRLASRNVKFAALSSTLEQDKFTLLWMIRLCPLPYSLSNGALSTIPSVSVGSFFLATALTSPKLLMHIFVGDRIARLGKEKDTAAKIVDIVSIVVASVIGTLTAYIIYNRTMERARQLELLNEDGYYAELSDQENDGFELSDEAGSEEDEESPRPHYHDDQV
ncbi:golgi apparatus membrane protein Tvp38p [Trichomonascus vanleenenianus]|uniref:Tvp38p n=1 Tax=Trichomonascus vanleenenianus TaxID=2268995 RepID=UPI003ECB3A9D